MCTNSSVHVNNNPDPNLLPGRLFKQIKTPIIWLGHDFDHQVKVWKDIPQCQSIMINAYQLHTRPLLREEIRKNGIYKHLDYKNYIFMDSGGFQFQKNGNANITPEELLELFMEVRPNIGAVLDIPLDPLISDKENDLRWNITLENTIQMVKKSKTRNFFIAPVIHSYDEKTAEDRGEQLRKIIKNPKIICIGSLVPLIKGSYIGNRFNTSNGAPGLSGTASRWNLISQLVLSTRKIFPEALIHVFGAGSLSSMYLLFLLGVDSVDSISWRLKAGFGAIQLPGKGDRHFEINNKETISRKDRILSKEELLLLERCQCPVCNGNSTESRLTKLKESFYSRATHNAYVVIEEVNRIAEMNTFKDKANFIEDRLRSHPYHQILETIILPKLENMCYNKKESEK